MSHEGQTWLIVPRHIGPPGVEWSIGIEDDQGNPLTAIDEGGQIFIRVSRNDTAATGAVNFRTMSVADFAAAFEGETQALSSDFVGANYPGDIQAAIGSGNPGVTYSAVAGIHTLIFADGASDFVFPRTAASDPDEQGDKRSVYQIFDPTEGEVVSGTASVVINDTFVAPPSLVIAIDNDTILYKASAGTVVGMISAAAGAFTGSPTLVADAGGRFEIGAEVSGEWPLRVKSGAVVDFENSAAPAFPLTRYNVTIRGVDSVGGGNIDFQVSIRMECPTIEPTGCGPNPEKTNVPTSISAFRQAFNNTTGNHLFKPSENTIDVWQVNANLLTILNADNVTIDWHHRLIPLRDGTFELGSGKNIIMRGVGPGCGGDAAGLDFENRDAFSGSFRGLLEEVLIENCTFRHSVDEIAVLISPGTGPWPRLVRFKGCTFVEPLFDAGHPKGDHPFGLLFYNSGLIIVVHECLFVGCGQRNPMIGLRNRGVHCFNNVVAWRGTGENSHGTIFAASGKSTVQHDQGGTVICEGNVYYPLNGSAMEGQSIMLRNCGSGQEFYIPEGTDYDNVNIRHTGSAWDFTRRPIARSDVALDDGSTSAALVSTPPFKPAVYGSGVRPTSDATEIQTLVEHVLDNAGTRAKDANGDFLPGDENLPKVDYDWMTQLRTLGTARRQTPATLESQYGADWKGGSLGSMVDLAA